MRLLLLAGTPEAVQIARALSREVHVGVTASLACGTRQPAPLGVPTRIGGWGGDAAFAEWLAREKVAAVLDATHPFARKISIRTADICRAADVNYIQFLRRPWKSGPHDSWTFLNREAEAEEHLPDDATVFLATGLRNIDRFGPLDGRTVHVRITSTPAYRFPFGSGSYAQRPPVSSVASEEALLHGLRVNWVVLRNTGGMTGHVTLEAARRLGLPVAMIRRPPQPEAPRIHTVAEALAWVRRRL